VVRGDGDEGEGVLRCGFDQRGLIGLDEGKEFRAEGPMFSLGAEGQFILPLKDEY